MDIVNKYTSIAVFQKILSEISNSGYNLRMPIKKYQGVYRLGKCMVGDLGDKNVSATRQFRFLGDSYKKIKKIEKNDLLRSNFLVLAWF